MNRLIEFFNKHLIITWVAGSILYAVIVNVCFGIDMPKWLRVKWSAGDILTYTSTISLGLLAVWQNKRLKEENEKSQNRLESISDRANELSVVQKIIEIESSKLERTRNALDEFTYWCNSKMVIATLDKGEGSPIIVRSNLDDLVIKIGNAFSGVTRVFNGTNKNNNSSHIVNETAESLYTYMKETIDKIYSNVKRYNDEELEHLNKLEAAFLEAKESYIFEQEEKINVLLYDNKTLEEIRDMFR